MDLAGYFTPRLRKAWDDGTSESVAVDDHHYLQWAGYRLGIQVECVSDAFLPPALHYSTRERQALRALGWQQPLGDDLPNYWRSFFDRHDLPVAVDLLVRTAEFLRSREQVRIEPGRVVVVLPAGGAEAAATESFVSLLVAAAEPDGVDGLGVADDEYPDGGVYMDAPFDEPSLLDDEPLYVQAPRHMYVQGLTGALRQAADLLESAQKLRDTGRHAVVALPPLSLADDPRWAVAREVADVVVVCLPTEGPGPGAAFSAAVAELAASRPVAVLDRGEWGDLAPGTRLAAVLADDDASIEQVPWMLAGVSGGSDETLLVQARVAALVWRRQAAFQEVLSSDGEPVGPLLLALLEDLAALVREHPSALPATGDLRLAEFLSIRIGWVDWSAPVARARGLPALQALADTDVGRRSLWGALLRQVRSTGGGRSARGSGGRLSEGEDHVRDEHLQPATIEGRAALAALLEQWLTSSSAQTIGEATTYGGRALLRVEVDGHQFHLNGDTRREGVRDYLELVRRHGVDLPWHVVANQSGKINKVALGDPPAAVKYFYLYADEAAQAPYQV